MCTGTCISRRLFTGAVRTAPPPPGETVAVSGPRAGAALLLLLLPAGLCAYEVVHDAAGNTVFQGPPTLDSDGDGVPDAGDRFPFDALEWADSDGDGRGDGLDDDDDGDGLPDVFEVAHGLSPLDASDATVDSDGDGYSNLDEFRFGTAPDDATSSPRITRDDFDGDGRSDLLWWNDATGEVRVWLMDGVTVRDRVPLAGGDSGWHLAGAGDVDADRRTDLIWHVPASGAVQIGYMGAAGLTTRTVADSVPPGWMLAGTGDFDRDMRSDLIWREAGTGRVLIWLMDGHTARVVEPAVEAAPGLRIVGIADFSGDGRDDIHWYDPSTRGNTLWVPDETGGYFHVVPSVLGDPGWQPAGAGPMDGDPYADMLWHQDGSGRLIFLRMQGGTYLGYRHLGYTWSTKWRLRQLADLDGTGRARIVWRNSNTGEVSVWRVDAGYVRQKAAYGDLPDAHWRIVR